jgi:hypothetical protein
MKTALKRVGIQVIGWLFVILGIAGLFLPFLQGFLFLFIGLLILSSEYVWAHNLVERMKQRFPRIGRHLDNASARWRAWRERRFQRRGESPSCD